VARSVLQQPASRTADSKMAKVAERSMQQRVKSAKRLLWLADR
jgi:hypothetical protein